MTVVMWIEGKKSGNSDGNTVMGMMDWGVEGGGKGVLVCTGVAVISIRLKVSFGDFEVFFGGDVIEAVTAPAQKLAGVTVAAWARKYGKRL